MDDIQPQFSSTDLHGHPHGLDIFQDFVFINFQSLNQPLKLQVPFG
jgi:hypothetical protein